MNEMERNEHPVGAEPHWAVAQTLLKSIGTRTVELWQAGTRKVAQSFDIWSQPVDGSEEDPFVVYDSIEHSIV